MFEPCCDTPAAASFIRPRESPIRSGGRERTRFARKPVSGGAMGVILQAVYKESNGHTVPSPYDGNRRIPWWWDHIASQANAFRQAGFSAVWLPPALKT